MIKQVVVDFIKIGPLRLLARIFMGARGLVIAISLDPGTFGEYTVWLLLVFYFTMLDFGVLNGLERDIPHYKGRNNAEQTSETWDFGFSSFFILSFGSSVLLAIVSYFVFDNPLLALLLGAYLFVDKVYRAYEANSRIHYQYKENAVGQVIIGILSLIFILVFLPRYGSMVVFVGFILSSLVGIVYLRRKRRLNFVWTFPLKKLWKFLLSSIPLALVTYSMDLFHVVALTVLAFKCDKVTLGYYAFAYRIFQILLAIFPYLIQEVMRVRMYSHIAKSEDWSEHLPKLFYPIIVYSFVTSVICLAVYWWSGWMIGHFAPNYLYSVRAIEMLSFVLLPIGIVKISSDYLCSRAINKTVYAVIAWALGIAGQVIALTIFDIQGDTILYIVPFVYLTSTLLVYILIPGTVFRDNGNWFKTGMRLILMLSPLVCAGFNLYVLRYLLDFHPTQIFVKNLRSFILSLIIHVLFFVLLKKLFGSQRRLMNYFTDSKGLVMEH